MIFNRFSQAIIEQNWLTVICTNAGHVEPFLPPGRRLYCNGDIHGHLDQLEELHEMIQEDAAGFGGRNGVVYLGDYIDRGSKSKQLLELLIEQPLSGFETITLMWICGEFTRSRANHGHIVVHGHSITEEMELQEAVSQQPELKNLAIYRESLYAIGMLYWQGDGVEQDYGVSAVWLKQAADVNHPGAQVKLGFLYVTGQGVPQNYGEAVKWFQMAAAQGDPDAKHNLDALFNNGLMPGSEPGSEPVAVVPVAVVPVAVVPVAGVDAGERWIQEQNPDHYTIQVIALREPEKLHAFIAQHADWTPFAIYGQTRYEKPLWVMVQGVYPDLESARAAKDAFPAGIQSREHLWIRKFEIVQWLIE